MTTSSEDARLVAGHVAVALSNHRKALRAQHRPEPVGLPVLADLFTAWSSRTTPDGPAAWPAAPLLAVDLETAAAAIGVSLRTVERLVADDELPSLRIGGSRRVRLRALEDYLRRQESAEAAPARQRPPSRLSAASPGDRGTHAHREPTASSAPRTA